MTLTGTMDFSKCRNIVIRGYNKAGLHSTVSAGIKDCAQFNPILIVPNVIVDAVGPADPADGNVHSRANSNWFMCVILFGFQLNTCSVNHIKVMTCNFQTRMV